MSWGAENPSSGAVRTVAQLPVDSSQMIEGFARPAQRAAAPRAAEAFLAEHLGGRVEPAHPGEEIEPFLR